MGKLEVENLTAGYGKPVIEGISFTLEPCEMVGLLGRNGCGKTTLLKAVSGALRSMEGSVRIDGQDLGKLKTKERAKCLAFMPQRGQLMQGIRVGEVISMGRYAYGSPFSAPTDCDRELAHRAARLLDIDALWERDCASLSEGQRQLVHLARVIAQDAELLLLDEPSSALDLSNSHHIFQSVRKLTESGGKSVLVVLHDPNLALRWCDRLLILEEGKLADSLTVARSDRASAEIFLRKLYPGIVVRENSGTTPYYCYME